MAAEIPNLVKRNKIYYFRCRIPSNLTNGRAREVKISLKTGNLTSDLLDVILKVTDYSRRVIAETLQNYNKGGANDMNIVSEIRSRIVQYINTSLIEQDIYTCEYGATCNASKAEGRKMMLNVCNSVENALKDNTIPQWATATADDLLKDVAVPDNLRNFAGREFLKGFLYCARVQREHLDGARYTTEYSPEDFNRVLGATFPSAQKIIDDEKFNTLGDLVKSYIAAPVKRCQKLHDDIINSLNLLCEWFGSETDIRKLSRREMRNFRDNVLRKLPANRKKSPGLRDKTLAEHLEDTKHDKISITTVNHHLARLSGFFSWCVDGEYITTNPVANMGLESDSKVSEERETYSKEELEKIITSLQQKNLCAWAPYKLWIPLIMLYCGCRQNEACQLFVSDIVEQDGVLCFSFAENEETGARVKNVSSIRTTPIHPVLLQMGFLSYVEQRIKSAGVSDTRKIQLWPECKYDKMNGYAGAFRRFFERFNRKYITPNPKRTCYSLRHNFIDNLKQSEVSENVVSEIAGHSNGKITYRRYGKALKATVKLDAMKKLDFGFDIFDVTGLSPKTEAEILAAAAVIQQSNSASA